MTNERESENWKYQEADHLMDQAAQIFIDATNFKFQGEPVQSFIKKVSHAVGLMFPQTHKGIGVSRILDQTQFIMGARNVDELQQRIVIQSAIHDFDCKLPSTFLCYVLKKLFKHNSLPYQVGMLTQGRSAHVLVLVAPTDEPQPDQEQLCYIIDYLPIDLTASSEVRPKNWPSLRTTIEADRLHFTTNFVKGMAAYDQRYLEALAEEDK